MECIGFGVNSILQFGTPSDPLFTVITNMFFTNILLTLLNNTVIILVALSRQSLAGTKYCIQIPNFPAALRYWVGKAYLHLQ